MDLPAAKTLKTTLANKRAVAVSALLDRLGYARELGGRWEVGTLPGIPGLVAPRRGVVFLGLGGTRMLRAGRCAGEPRVQNLLVVAPRGDRAYLVPNPRGRYACVNQDETPTWMPGRPAARPRRQVSRAHWLRRAAVTQEPDEQGRVEVRGAGGTRVRLGVDQVRVVSERRNRHGMAGLVRVRSLGCEHLLVAIPSLDKMFLFHAPRAGDLRVRVDEMEGVIVRQAEERV